MEIIIPLDPKTKKNSGQICRGRNGRIFFRPSKPFEEYQEQCRLYMPRMKPIAYPVNVKAIYYMGTRRRVDITNLHNALHDMLVYYGVLADDNSRIVVSTDGSRVRYDKNAPRTEVTITPSEE